MARRLQTAIPGSRSLGRFIARRRQDLGLNQEAFATLLGWSRKTVSKLENGHRPLYDEGDLMLLARHLRLDDDLMREIAVGGPEMDKVPEPQTRRVSLDDSAVMMAGLLNEVLDQYPPEHHAMIIDALFRVMAYAIRVSNLDWVSAPAGSGGGFSADAPGVRALRALAGLAEGESREGSRSSDTRPDADRKAAG